MARVYLEHVREKNGSEFPPKPPWWAWALRHAAWVCNNFHVRADTRVTPCAKIRLKTYTQPVLPFGELVLARRPTDEHIVGSKAGVFRTGTVRKLTEDKSWSTEAVADMEWTPWKTPRGRPPKAVVGERPEPIWNAPLPEMPSACREPPPRPAAPDAKSTSDKPEMHEVPLPDSDDEAAKRSPMDEESTPVPNPGSASSSSSTAAPDPCVTTPVRQARPRSPDPSENVVGKSLVSPLPKKLRSAVGEDDDNMTATIAEITEVCEEPQPDWESLASNEMSAQRGPCAGTVHEWYIWGT